MNILFASLLSISSLTNPGWTKLDSENTFADVAISRAEHDQIISETNSYDFWGGIGPDAVFRAWTTAAYDPDKNIMYFFGGGHSDYGGNEIYSYDLNTLTWARVTEPAPLTKPEPHSQVQGKTVYVPESSPISSHTHDCFIWNRDTQSIWVASRHGYGGDGTPSHTPEDAAMWEFSIETKTWRKLPAFANPNYPKCINVPSMQKVFLLEHAINEGFRGFLYDYNGTVQYLGRVDGLNASGVGSVFMHPETGAIYSAHQKSIYKITFGGTAESPTVSATKVTDHPSLEELNFELDYRQASYNYRPVDGKFYIWNGGPQIITWDPNTKQYDVIWNDDSPERPSLSGHGVGKVFEKFVYVKKNDIFVGLQNGGDGQGTDGMWAWKPSGSTDSAKKLRPLPLQNDGVTQTAAAFFLPIEPSDRNYNSTVSLRYKRTVDANWSAGPQLHRMRPEFVRNTKNNNGISGEGFSTIITGLEPGTQYAVELNLNDPDGVVGYSQTTASFTTANTPEANLGGDIVTVSSPSELNSALGNAKPGLTIRLLPGIYQGTFEIKKSGTKSEPIKIVGTGAAATVIDAQGNHYGFRLMADHIHISSVSVTNAKTAIKFDANTTGVSIYSNYIFNNLVGISAKLGQRNLYIAHNVLEGSNLFGNVSSETWDMEGIVVTGNSIEVAHNTLSGFGDSLGLHWNTNIANYVINMHHNLIKWGGDDGIEFDFTLRNVAAHHNMIANSANALSFQPVWGGPAYAFKNIILNPARGPFKIKPEQDGPSGMYIVNNTVVKWFSNIERGGGYAWKNASGDIKLLNLNNNLFVSDETRTDYILLNSSTHSLVDFDNNAWSADGKFSFKLKTGSVFAKSFQEWKDNTPLGNNDIKVNAETVFKNYQPNIKTGTFNEYRDPLATPLQISENSNLVDKGKRVPQIAFNYSGASPDIGALELNESMPEYGATLDTTLPEAPIAVNDSKDTEVNIDISINVLENDSDLQGDPLTLIDLIEMKNGSATFSPDGTVDFSPEFEFMGEASVKYIIEDNKGNRSEATLTVNVLPPNKAPVASPDVFEVFETSPLEITFNQILENDYDPERRQLTVIAVNNPMSGRIEMQNDKFIYTAPESFIGTDEITYEIEDNLQAKHSSTITIDVLPNGTIVGSDYRDNYDLRLRTEGFTIYGKGGADIITGSSGDDVIVGGEHEDSIKGGEGDDIIKYLGDNDKYDHVEGGPGFDQIIGNKEDNFIGLTIVQEVEAIDGGEGYDIIQGQNNKQVYDFSNTQLKNIELIDGGAGSDEITGSASDDVIMGSAGNDKIDGGPGNDTAVYKLNFDKYSISIENGVVTVEAIEGDEGVDTLINIERLMFKDRGQAVGKLKP
ncbi:Ig-like domain-containing protein [Flocculibacter collagenilyticus]|uniref:Ig-like domain-containing protein n=1 Tax=Flocculibacter collagenilyticus TaxID=2744479 RepID=UPI0018F62788|nr:Ig-like domain-containing protein [Flocculibacter collagenilyticus]